MSGYLSNLLTTTTSRYNSLRRTLLSDEADGDTEDDSHISRVLRAYYTEKGRGFPPWLPPDPKRPLTQSTPSFSSSLRQPAQAQGAAYAPPRGTLSDLWDPPAQQSAAPSQPASLRRQAQARSAVQGRSQDTLQSPQARPLPSQRAGSYQSQVSQMSSADTSPPSSSGAGGGGTAQERLKARLWGSGRSTSPTTSFASSGGSTASANPAYGQSGGGNPYATQQGYEGGYDNSEGYGGRSGRERVGIPNGPRPR